MSQPNSVVVLTNQNFKLGRSRSDNKLLLFNTLDHMSVVLFYSQTCEYCPAYVDRMIDLTNRVGNCTFCICNVDDYPSIIQLSNQSDMPLTYVPYVVLFIRGMPIMRYDGQPEINEMILFIQRAADHIRQHFMTSNGQLDIPEASDVNTLAIPEYSLGRPMKGTSRTRRCYLKMSNAI